jgi:hypothetical protein
MSNTINRVGSPAAPRIRPLHISDHGQVSLPSPKGEDSVVVIRQSGQVWKPASLEQMQACLAHTQPEMELGLWQDQRRFLILPPDGKIQPEEVRTLTQDQAQGNLILCDVQRKIGRHDAEYSVHTARVDADKAFINDQNQLVEPRTVRKSEHAEVVAWGVARRVGYYPSKYSHTTYGQ